jgi:hypothetical protein
MTDGKTKQSASNGYSNLLNFIHPSFLHISNFDLLLPFTNILTLPQVYDHKCKILYSSIKKLKRLIV